MVAYKVQWQKTPVPYRQTPLYTEGPFFHLNLKKNKKKIVNFSSEIRERPFFAFSDVLKSVPAKKGPSLYKNYKNREDFKYEKPMNL